MLTLDQIATGSTVKVSGISESSPQLHRKLHAMGVVNGCSIKVLGRAPLGDPISISVLGYTLSLRIAEAKLIQVVPAAE